eukprot:6176191-Pleurochrysis_carterae.AAC.3
MTLLRSFDSSSTHLIEASQSKVDQSQHQHRPSSANPAHFEATAAPTSQGAQKFAGQSAKM